MMAATLEATGVQSRLRAILSGSVGNLVEWYDWYTYSATALYFAPVFFPKGDQTAQLLQTAAVFAVGFFARPVGAWVMGRYSDRAGRKAALTLSVAMMCLGSLVIAVTPGAAQIGIAAPIILLLARIFQGLSLGGEYGASATYMSETAGRAHRGFWSSFNYVTLIGIAILPEYRRAGGRARQPPPSPAPIPARNADHPRVDGRGLHDLLRLHHVHAEISDQYRRILQSRRH
jgi:MHS family alpha-ketoglutarate permease-like MFS transporter